MAAKYDLTWDGTHTRWRIMYRGKRYIVSCRQLGMPPTKEASYQAANAWWAAKLGTLIPSPIQHPYQVQRDHLAQEYEWATKHGSQADIQSATVDLAGLDFVGVDTTPESVELVNAIMGPAPQSFTKHPIPEVTPEDQNINGQIDRRLIQLKARVHADSLSAGSYANTRDCLYHFRDWIGGMNPPSKINADTLEDFHNYLLGMVTTRKNDPTGKAGWSRDYALKVFGQSKSLISYMAGKGILPLPANIQSKGFKFGSPAKKIITMSNDEVTLLITHAKGQLKLHLLLMLNCGMTQTDISDLKDDEVDWKNGRIIRKRSKTDDKATTPTVSYKLWPKTFSLLKDNRSGQPTVLLTRSGGLWAWESLDSNGNLHSAHLLSDISEFPSRSTRDRRLRGCGDLAVGATRA